jgi:hypothetical protein
MCCTSRADRHVQAQWVPALPAEARTIREDNGKRPALAAGPDWVSTSAAVYVGKNYAKVVSWWKGEGHQGGH